MDKAKIGKGRARNWISGLRGMENMTDAQRRSELTCRIRHIISNANGYTGISAFSWSHELFRYQPPTPQVSYFLLTPKLINLTLIKDLLIADLIRQVGHLRIQ